ncbi:hypothetical protein DPMN_074822 [Dreissena polymorpha]|uniref:Uncharacterized protein n=1 Tax=Dreissena polymorpha TaxID=45954 RepID=A0A9D3YJ80_DREPO|nr:hypothetical protein DPMN_074822 [Dreissena polymorpha]
MVLDSDYDTEFELKSQKRSTQLRHKYEQSRAKICHMPYLASVYPAQPRHPHKSSRELLCTPLRPQNLSLIYTGQRSSLQDCANVLEARLLRLA